MHLLNIAFGLLMFFLSISCNEAKQKIENKTFYLDTCKLVDILNEKYQLKIRYSYANSSIYITDLLRQKEFYLPTFFQFNQCLNFNYKGILIKKNNKVFAKNYVFFDKNKLLVSCQDDLGMLILFYIKLNDNEVELCRFSEKEDAIFSKKGYVLFSEKYREISFTGENIDTLVNQKFKVYSTLYYIDVNSNKFVLKNKKVIDSLVDYGNVLDYDAVFSR